MSQSVSLQAEGEELIRRLFEIGKKRLKERGINLQFAPDVANWLLDQTEWRSGLNPLRTLDGHWHHWIAKPIEVLMVDRSLLARFALSIVVDRSNAPPQIAFQISPHAADRDRAAG